MNANTLDSANDKHIIDRPSIATRRVAVLACDGVNEAEVDEVRRALQFAGARVEVVSNRSGFLLGTGGKKIRIDHHWLDMPSVMFDAAYIPGGAQSLALMGADPDALQFVRQLYDHGKALAATSDGVEMLLTIGVILPDQHGPAACQGVVTDRQSTEFEQLSSDFVAAIIKDRHWRRPADDMASLH